MSARIDPISVRTARLDNLIVGRKSTSSGTAGSQSGRRSLSVGAVNAAIADALHRESLLDCFCLLFNECDKDALKKRDKNIAEFVAKYRPIVEETRQLRVNPSDFTIKTIIGKGYFGNVHLVIEKVTGDVYAMKKIKKSVITTSQVKVERDIMCRRNSEWITQLQYAFQDNESLYLIMEFLPGGDLLSLMTRNGPFNEELVRFYLAEMTLAINALHSMGYIHRDIKPENILIDRFGHIKLADFGNAAAMDRDGHVMSLSPVGTPDYIAPELLQTISTYKLTKSMLDTSCDYWSMGIIGYELVCEVTPFHEDNVHETYSKILSHCEESHLKETVNFPSDLEISDNFKNLILCLVTNPKNRLNYSKIKKHPFFNNIKWDSLRSQVPPIIPNVQSEDDTSNFEETTKHRKGRTGIPAKKSISTNMKSNEFSGKDLPFIGYTFVHIEEFVQCSIAPTEDIGSSSVVSSDEPRSSSKLSNKVRELQTQLKFRTDEIVELKQQLVRAEQIVKRSTSQSKMLQDAKEDMNKMKNIIREKTASLAACKTQIKTLQNCVQTEQEMWAQKEATISELLRMNRQKYEEAKTASEQRYESLLVEKNQELSTLKEKLDARETEMIAKTEECGHLQEKMENYKELLRQSKEQAHIDREEFEKSKTQLIDTYEQKFVELRKKLRKEKDSQSRLTMELREVRHELSDSICSSKFNQEAKKTTEKNNDDILRRLNIEVEKNNSLHAQNNQLQSLLTESQKAAQSYEHEIQRLERELKVIECGKSLAKSNISNDQTPFETAPGSLTELRTSSNEDQLRVDLELAKENEIVQRERADKLQEIVAKLEEMIDKFNENNTVSPSKPLPAPRNTPSGSRDCVGDMLERQNEKLEDKLESVREQMILERQAARTANLSLWKVEKKLEEAISEKKMIQRRMDLTEERIKKVQGERDETQLLYKEAREQTRQREERIKDLKDEIITLKDEVLSEHEKWKKSEEERMQSKSEIIEHISTVQKLEERVSELSQKLRQTQTKCDSLASENKRFMHDVNEEREKSSAIADNAAQVKIQMKSLQDNYERLKYACTITDNQLTEIELMLEKEQKRNASQQEKIDKLYASLRKKDELVIQLRKELSDIRCEKSDCDGRLKNLHENVETYKNQLEELQRKLATQQHQLAEQARNFFAAQERIEVLTTDSNHLQTLNANQEREIITLKEENARILSELFHAKEEVSNLQEKLKEVLTYNADLRNELEDLRAELVEKQNYYLQREIKSEATLTQHKKLIDYLQLKVEDLSQKKTKKTLADMIFFGYNTTGTCKKENISPNVVEQSILYRTVQEELRREKQHNKTLQEQIDILSGKDKKSRKRNSSLNVRNQNNEDCQNQKGSDDQTQKKELERKSDIIISKNSQTHRFELTLLESSANIGSCLACQKRIPSNSSCWKCKECKATVHRKCRGDVNVGCAGVDTIVATGAPTTDVVRIGSMTMPSAPKMVCESLDLDGNSVGKYSYEAQVDVSEDAASREQKNAFETNGEYTGNLVFGVDWNLVRGEPLEINCAYDIEEQKVILFGCNLGLFAYHLDTKQLVHISGIDSVDNIAISLPLTKAILIGSRGESIYQCDFRHLQSRCQASACLKPTLEASILDLPFSNRAPHEKWQLIEISNECKDVLDSVAIAATSTRIVLLKYDVKLQKFKPVRALDTSAPVTAVTYTNHTAIVSSDKFFEIDLSSYAAEEFVDLSDHTLSHTVSCQPVVATRISRQEFLLCFMECGVFIDEYGCRSRPYDINWKYTPTGFLYCEPFLYIAHFQSVQIIRLHRSYTKEIASANHDNLEGNDHEAALQRVYLKFYMPSLLAKSGKQNILVLSIDKDSGLQQVYHLDAVKAFRNKFNDSMETISSIATSVTFESIGTTDSM